MRSKLPPWWLLLLLIVAGFAAVTALIFWQVIAEVATVYEAPLKVLSLVLGPFATIASIYWGYKSKQDLVDQSNQQAEEFGKDAQAFTEKAQRFAENIDQARTEIANKSEQLGFLRSEAEQARREAEDKGREILQAETALRIRGERIESLEGDLRRITEGSGELWKIREQVGDGFPEYRTWLRDPAGAKILTVANLKGGVGKTTLSANLAAYVSQRFKKSVLLLDLDYQGSLSNMLMQAAEKEVVESSVDQLFEASAENALARLSRARVQLDPTLPKVWITPASYSLAQVENRLLFKWLLNEAEGVDIRYRLANILLNPSVRAEYKLIILDTPPRMTIGTINALVTSHHFLIPTALDKLSTEAVPQFITNMKAIKKDLELDIDLAGIAGMMSRVATLGENEQSNLNRARQAGDLWESGRDFVLKQTIPRRSAISDAAGGKVAYFEKDGSNNPLAQLFDPLFAEICENMGLD